MTLSSRTIAVAEDLRQLSLELVQVNKSRLAAAVLIVAFSAEPGGPARSSHCLSDLLSEGYSRWLRHDHAVGSGPLLVLTLHGMLEVRLARVIEAASTAFAYRALV